MIKIKTSDGSEWYWDKETDTKRGYTQLFVFKNELQNQKTIEVAAEIGEKADWEILSSQIVAFNKS